GYDASPEHSEDHADELGDIGQVNDDAVTGFESAGQQACCDLRGMLVKLPVTYPLAIADNRHAIRMLERASAQHGAKSFALPVPGLAIMLYVFVGPAMLGANVYCHENECACYVVCLNCGWNKL